MKIKLSSLLIALALIMGMLAACYPISGDSEYRTLPLGTGTLAPVVFETDEPETTSEIPEETTLPVPETTTVEIPDETTAEVIVTTEAETTEEVTEAPPVIITYEYDVIEDKRELGEIGGQKYYAVIRYPALTGIEDAKIQEKINTTIMQHAVFQYENALPNASELISSGSAVSYEVTSAEVTYMGGGLLSARSEGVIDHANDTNDLKFAYSIIIDLSTGRDISPKKIYSDFGSIITLFTSGKFKQISGEESLLSSLSLEKLMENYKYYAQYSTYPETYFTQDSLVIILDTDRENGFFAEFSIALTEVNGYLQKSPTK
jgi:hypothetical protein